MLISKYLKLLKLMYKPTKVINSLKNKKVIMKYLLTQNKLKKIIKFK